MTKKAAFNYLTDYLENNYIHYVTSIDNGALLVTMVFHVEHTPSKIIEACVWFYEDFAEARVYYSAFEAEIVRESKYADELFRLLNYINATVFLACGQPGGLYEPHILYTPRLYLTEDDGGDISMTTIINYDFWALAPLETHDYISRFCPELLDKLSVAIFGLLWGHADIEFAIYCIKKEILKEDERRT